MKTGGDADTTRMLVPVGQGTRFTQSRAACENGDSSTPIRIFTIASAVNEGPSHNAPSRLGILREGAGSDNGAKRLAGAVLCLLRGLEVEGRRVHAVAKAGRLGTVVEHVPQVRVAASAADLVPLHEQGAVLADLDVLLRDRIPEAGPARARLELRVRAEELGAAGDAPVDALG